MTKGVLIFAQNNPEVDYAKIALFAAMRVKEYLDVPVTLVTDAKDWILSSQPQAKNVFDTIIPTWTETIQTKKFYDGSLASKSLVWKNLTRSDCFDHSPYDETLVIDSDFIISSHVLNNVWNNDNDFLIYRNSYDLAQWRNASSFQYLNPHAIPFYWATVFYFKKTEATSSFFFLIKHIKENWSYYRSFYNIDTPTFRNDFAFSIAIHIMNDRSDSIFAKPLPGKMFYALDRDILLDIKDNKMKFLVEKENYHGEYTLVKTEGLDVHVMNKFSLTRHIDGVLNV